MKLHIKTLQKQVEIVLAEMPEARDSDITLKQEVIRRWYSDKITMVDGEEAILFKDEHHIKATHPAVKRIRAKIQNEQHRFLPTTWKVAKKRKIAEDVWRAYAREPEMSFHPATAFGNDALIRNMKKAEDNARDTEKTKKRDGGRSGI